MALLQKKLATKKTNKNMISKTVYEFEGKTFDTLKEFYEWGAENVVHGWFYVESLDEGECEYQTIYLPSYQIKDFKQGYSVDSFEDFTDTFGGYFYDEGTEISEGRMIYDSEEIDKEQALYFFIAVIAEEHLKLTEQVEYTPKRIYGLYEGKKYIAPIYFIASVDMDTAVVQYLDGKQETIDTNKLTIKNVHLLNANR